jgi:spore maturation protein CgeB
MRILVYESEVIVNRVRYPHKQALEELGHSVDVFDWKQFLPTYINSDNLSKLKEKILLKRYTDNINTRLKKVIKSSQYDLFLVIMGKYIYPETVEFSKQNIKLVVNWNTDEPFNALNSSEWLLDSLPLYDANFTPRMHLIKEYEQYGMKNIFEIDWYYRFGVRPCEKQENAHKYDVGFIGAWSGRRGELISSIEHGVELYGWGWSKKLIKKNNHKIHNHISILDMMNIFNNTKININILTTENKDTTNLRNFEIPASNSFQLSERSERIKGLYEEDKEIVLFSSKEELIDKCNFYLKNDSVRNKIAYGGYKRLIKCDYSLVNRLKKILLNIKEL